jgi:hypothetical protein
MMTKEKQPSSRMNILNAAANGAFIVGFFSVFQSGYEWLYPVGLALVTLGTVGSLGLMLVQGTHWIPWLERASVLGMLVGILGMFQAWDIWLYEYGFYLLCLTTLGFIIVMHLSVPDDDSAQSQATAHDGTSP